MTKTDLADRLKKIKLVLTDCDGVLTDAGVYYGAQGETLKRFNIRDGMGVERLRDIADVETGIVTGEMSGSVSERARKLAIGECHLGAKNKAAVIGEIMERRRLTAEQIAFIGDDVNDIPAFNSVGLTACPADAFPSIRERADIVLNTNGGHGVFREFAELLLAHRG